MHLSEPLTTLTDYALGGASLYFAIVLLRVNPPKWRSIRLWSIGFFASAVAAFVGGTFHALKFQVADSVLNALWNITVYSIGASGACRRNPSQYPLDHPLDRSLRAAFRLASLTHALG